MLSRITLIVVLLCESLSQKHMVSSISVKPAKFVVMYQNQTVPSDSTTILQTLQISHPGRCISACHIDTSCFLAIIVDDSVCYLCKLSALGELISTTSPSTSKIWYNPNKIPSNYWLIKNNLKDYISGADLLPGAGFSTIFGSDRFGDSSGALRSNNSYYQAPAGSYLSSSFTITGWVSLIAADPNARFLDFSSGPGTDSVAVRVVDPSGSTTQSFAVSQSGTYTSLSTSFVFNLNEWYHLAAVMDGLDIYLYVNGVLQMTTSGSVPSPGDQTLLNCLFGRSTWYPSDSDANALFDDIKIFRRALTLDEILNDMQFS